jgi:hypothetical protein
MRILEFGFDGGTENSTARSILSRLSGRENVTKWHEHSSLGLILSAFCKICRAWPVTKGPGGKIGRKTAEDRPKL